MPRLIPIVVALLVFWSAAFFLVSSTRAEIPQQPDRYDASLRKGESRETLDPAQFEDPKIRKAYQVAQDIPWVLDSIYCFCYCHESPAFRHTSLLSCYVDLHAAR